MNNIWGQTHSFKNVFSYDRKDEFFTSLVSDSSPAEVKVEVGTEIDAVVAVRVKVVIVVIIVVIIMVVDNSSDWFGVVMVVIINFT